MIAVLTMSFELLNFYTRKRLALCCCFTASSYWAMSISFKLSPNVFCFLYLENLLGTQTGVRANKLQWECTWSYPSLYINSFGIVQRQFSDLRLLSRLFDIRHYTLNIYFSFTIILFRKTQCDVFIITFYYYANSLLLLLFSRSQLHLFNYFTQMFRN